MSIFVLICFFEFETVWPVKLETLLKNTFTDKYSLTFLVVFVFIFSQFFIFDILQTSYEVDKFWAGGDSWKKFIVKEKDIQILQQEQLTQVYFLFY